MLVYATVDQFTTWTGKPQDDSAKPLLRYASSRVADACRCDIYDTQPNGLPVDDDKRIAMQEASCAQAERWSELGVNPAAGAGGLDVQITASSIDGASISTTAATVDAAKAASLVGLCELAMSILRDAGLASASVISW
ncbi:hypothetical protein B2J88_08040 [Rhodococcus sp. SRB_17]|nr:hypothetical protein [Rhodococcus sp. SRB_17]